MTTLLSKVRERWKELVRIYGGQKREVRLTAVGWNPGGWTEETGPTASGNREYYTVVRAGETFENAEQPARSSAWTAEEILQREG